MNTLKVSTLFAAAGTVLLLAGCAAGTSQAGADAPTSTPTSTSDPSLNLTPGGAFATQAPAPGGHIDQAQALAAAKLQVAGLMESGGTAAAKAQAQVLSAAANVRTQSYTQLLTLLNNPSGQQLDGNASVIEVTIDTPVSSEALPSAAGATRATGWPQISVAYDARTGLTLWEGPTPIATMSTGG